MNHALTQAEDGCWFRHLGAVLQADLPSPGTGRAKADAKGGAGVDLPHSGGARQLGSPERVPSKFLTDASDSDLGSSATKCTSHRYSVQSRITSAGTDASRLLYSPSHARQRQLVLQRMREQ